MKSDRSSLFSAPEFAYDCQPSSALETMLLRESGNSNFVVSTSVSAADTHTSEKGIMVALGFIATLLFFSGLQLYRSINTNPIRVQEFVPYRAYTIKVKNSTAQVSTKLARYAPSRRIETLSIQNAISHGKF